MEPLFYGFWEGLFSIGLNWIFVALVCRRLFVALVCRQLFCVGLSLALLKGFGTAETFWEVQNSSSIMILQKRNRTARVPYFETKKRP